MADSARGSDNLIIRANNSEDNNNKLQCVYMNARSIVNKMKVLELTVKQDDLDLVAITETWLHDKITDEEISIEGYTLIRNDRKDINKHRGGGVALYIKNELNPIHKTESYVDAFTESVWCNIRCGREITLLGVCYRAPDSSASNDENLYRLLNEVSKDRVVVMGDFNFANLDWSKLENLDSLHPYLDCLNNNFLLQQVDKPSR